ncbi:spherulin-4 [Aspergillus udagawae]|nr:spherulin-4 [Aspergillus udagawae]
MFQVNFSHVLVGLMGCMTLVQQGHTACIPSYRPHEKQKHSADRGWRHSHTSVSQDTESTYSAGAAYSTSAYASAFTEPASISIPTATPTASATAASGTSASKGNIMIPWYLYPAEGAWTPMEELINSNPDVQFTIIINPDNGPGSTPLADENFLAAVPRLTAYSNALVIGYVRTGKGTRDIAEVKQEINTYAGWPSASGNSSFAVHGIFLDEAPSEYDAAAVTYYKQLATFIRGSKGLGPNNHVVTNPGTVPDTAYLSIPDATVIFESPYSEFVRALSSDQFQGIKGQDTSRFASMVYDVPDTVNLSTLLSQLRAISSQTYLSNLNTYQAFDSIWTKVVSLLSA